MLEEQGGSDGGNDQQGKRQTAERGVDPELKARDHRHHPKGL